MKGIILTISLLYVGLVYGYSRFKREIPNGYAVKHPCPGKGHWDAVGHMSAGYTPQKNVFGENFRDLGKIWTVELCQMDSDGDGLTNGEELGDPQCKWRRGDRAGDVRGHPGFCEPDRAKCDSGMTHDECRNRHARGRGRGRGRGQQRRLPAGANDHPQTTLSKNIDQTGGVGRGLFGRGQSQSFGTDRGMPFGQPSGVFGGRTDMSSGGFDNSFGGPAGRPSVRFDTSGPQSFLPPESPSITSFSSRSGAGSFGSTGLTRDFGVSDRGFMGAQTSGVSGGSGSGVMMGRSDFPGMQSPGMDRFSSSLDQRSIQGFGSPASGPSFTSSMSQMDIERSVQSRMERERTRSGSGEMRPSMGSGSTSFSSMGSSGMGSDGMSSMGGDFMGPMGSGGMSPMGSGGIGPMGSGSMGPMGSGFTGGMDGPYPPFMPGGSPGFFGPSFSGGGASMPGTTFSGGMSMSGAPGMSRGPGGTMMGSPFSRRF